MKQKKFRLEKVLHELIRDLPEVEKINAAFDGGMITNAEAFVAIAEAITREKKRT